MSKGSGTGLFTLSSCMALLYHDLLFSQFTVRALVNRFPNLVWVTDVVFELEIHKKGAFLFWSHCFPSFETFPISAGRNVTAGFVILSRAG